jgi:hypothetical protein
LDLKWGLVVVASGPRRVEAVSQFAPDVRRPITRRHCPSSVSFQRSIIGPTIAEIQPVSFDAASSEPRVPVPPPRNRALSSASSRGQKDWSRNRAERTVPAQTLPRASSATGSWLPVLAMQVDHSLPGGAVRAARSPRRPLPIPKTCAGAGPQ